jgi:tRNA(Ile2) C34 agmatinyltransferase TiaS
MTAKRKEKTNTAPACPDCGRAMRLVATGYAIQTFRCPVCKMKLLDYVRNADGENTREEE